MQWVMKVQNNFHKVPIKIVDEMVSIVSVKIKVISLKIGSLEKNVIQKMKMKKTFFDKFYSVDIFCET